VVAVRALRGLADGFVSVFLADHLLELGFSALEVGVVVTATLVGSAALTLAVGLRGHRYPTRSVLLAATGLMVATGLGFAAATSFAALLVIALLGTMNPNPADVSVFLPVEQAFLAGHARGTNRTRLYALYNLGGALAGAAGALLAVVVTGRGGFLVYSAIGAVAAALYWRLPRDRSVKTDVTRPLHQSRDVVLRLAALFSLDSAGGGLIAQSLLVLWLHLRWDLSVGTTGAVFFVAGTLTAFSQLVAARLARRIGLIRTMAFTHLPANACVVLAAFAPSASLAVALLLVRALLSQMDVPARQAFVMAVVQPDERAAAASVTNVPRSLAAAVTPALTGWLFTNGWLSWPLVLAGLSKGVYDVLLLAQFRDVVVQEDAV
jgi:MFS family permease